jgi:hypothetical protein
MKIKTAKNKAPIRRKPTEMHGGTGRVGVGVGNEAVPKLQ